MALAQARTATDALRAQLTAEKIQAQQRTAGFEKTKHEMEVRGFPASLVPVKQHRPVLLVMTAAHSPV